VCDEGVAAAGSVGCDGELMCVMKLLRLLVVLAVMVS